MYLVIERRLLGWNHRNDFRSPLRLHLHVSFSLVSHVFNGKPVSTRRSRTYRPGSQYASIEDGRGQAIRTTMEATQAFKGPEFISAHLSFRSNFGVDELYNSEAVGASGLLGASQMVLREEPEDRLL